MLAGFYRTPLPILIQYFITALLWALNLYFYMLYRIFVPEYFTGTLESIDTELILVSLL